MRPDDQEAPITGTGIQSDIPDNEAGEVSPAAPKKPWPLSWIVIIILVYITFQMVYFLFFTD